MKQLIFAIVALLAAPLAGSDLWFHMNVHGAGGERVMLNLPFDAVARSLPRVMDAARGDCRIEVNGRELHGSELRDVIGAVRSARAGGPAVVRNDGSTIEAARSGDTLILRAKGRCEPDDGEIRMPMWLAEALVSGRADELNVRAAVNAIVAHREGTLAVVSHDGSNVRFWVDRSAE